MRLFDKSVLDVKIIPLKLCMINNRSSIIGLHDVDVYHLSKEQ